MEATGGLTPDLFPIDPNHGMHMGPGYIGDATHSLRMREVFKYYQPSPTAHHIPSLNTGEDFVTEHSNLSPNVRSSDDPILSVFANHVARTLDARRCFISITGAGITHIVAESTRSLSLFYPHTHDHGDHLMLGGGIATSSIGGLCEHSIALLPPPLDSDEPFLLEIPDLSRHPKYFNAGYVRGWPHGRFYAGVPMRTKNGASIGTVCVLDDKPRDEGLTPSDRNQLIAMAEIVMSYLEIRQGGRNMQKSKIMEMELSRFIAEGFLPDDAAMVTERRDGRLLSKRSLAKRKAKEMLRRKRVEEKRQMLQEKEFAKMVRRVQNAEAVDTGLAAIAPTATTVVTDGVSCTAFASTGAVINQANEPGPGATSPTQDLAASVNATEAPVLIAHTRPQQPGLVVMSPADEAKESCSLVDTIIAPLFQDLDVSIEASPSVSPGSQSEGYSSFLSVPTPGGTTESFEDSVTVCGTINSEIDYFSSQGNKVEGGLMRTTPSATSPHDLSSISKQNRRSSYEQPSTVKPYFRAMFSRAATLVRNAINADVLFLDSDLEGLFEPDSPAPSVIEGDAVRVSTDPDAESRARAHRPKAVRRKEGILGYATSGGSSQSRSNPLSHIGSVADLGFDVSELNQEALDVLVKQCGGQIVVNTDVYPGLEDARPPPRQLYKSILQRFLPSSRSVIIVPLYDHNDSLFAVCFAWTCDPEKSFVGNIEGSFVKAVVQSIVAEITRLNILHADKAKGDFISSISHELRSPLHGILASAQFLLESTLDLDQRLLVDTIISCGTTLLDTVNHVLEFQKLSFMADVHPKAAKECTDAANEDSVLVQEATGDELAESSNGVAIDEKVETDLATLVQDVTDGVCLSHGFKLRGRTIAEGQMPSAENISFVVDIERRETGWTFVTDPVALRRITNNIVCNALKYNKESGYIHVSLSARDTSTGKTRVVLQVSDSGKGISREFLKTKLFTPFCQENPLSAGVGLGMSIVRQLVSLMGGKIDVQSQLGQGTTVRVEVDMDQVPQKSRAPPLLDARVAGMKVMLVGFDQKDRGSVLLKQSVTRYMEQYFDMVVVEDRDAEAEILLVGSTAHIRGSSTKATKLPVIQMGHFPPEGSYARNIVFLRKPCSVKKLAQAVNRCVEIMNERENRDTLGIEKDVPESAPRPSTPAPSEHSVYHDAMELLATPPGARYLPLAPETPKDRKPTILAVEDNPINMMLLTKHLKKHDYPFATANDGLQAVNHYVSTLPSQPTSPISSSPPPPQPPTPDVILMDLQMPVMSGVEATREIRRIERESGARRCLIVALTGLAAERDRRMAEEAGVDGFLVKPVKFGEVEKVFGEGLVKTRGV